VAPRIRRGHNLSAGRSDVTNLARQQGFGLFGLRQRVDAGASTTPGRLGQFGESDTWKQAQQLARLTRDLLTVHEVTGLVIRDRRRPIEWS
jgi:hypothetical protein